MLYPDVRGRRMQSVAIASQEIASPLGVVRNDTIKHGKNVRADESVCLTISC
jgi:hypothetical protein